MDKYERAIPESEADEFVRLFRSDPTKKIPSRIEVVNGSIVRGQTDDPQIKAWFLSKGLSKKPV